MFTPKDAKEMYCAIHAAPCRADECMHWRWMFDRVSVMEMQHQEYKQQGFGVVSMHASSTGLPMVTMMRQREQGYCGLSGKPEC